MLWHPVHSAVTVGTLQYNTSRPGTPNQHEQHAPTTYHVNFDEPWLGLTTELVLEADSPPLDGHPREELGGSLVSLCSVTKGTLITSIHRFV